MDEMCFAHPAPCWCAMSMSGRRWKKSFRQHGWAEIHSTKMVAPTVFPLKRYKLKFASKEFLVPITSKWLGLPSRPTSPETPFGFAIHSYKVFRHLRHVRDKVPKDKSVTGMPISTDSPSIRALRTIRKLAWHCTPHWPLQPCTFSFPGRPS